MTRDEFMKHAAEEIDAAFRGQKVVFRYDANEYRMDEECRKEE